MSENEETPQKNYGPFVRFVVVTMGVAVMLVLTIRSCRQDRQWKQEFQEKYYPSFERAKAQLLELADKGCQVPFEDCRRPDSAVQRVLDAMDREKIAFGTHDVTQEKLDELEAKAEVRIASQKLAYLMANGGAKLPSDIKLLKDVCAQVYVYKRKLLPNHPTDSELKQLLPPGVREVDYCLWDHN